MWIGWTASPLSSHHSASPAAVKSARTSRRSARARSRQVRIPHGESRAARRPAIPVISVTGRSIKSSSSPWRSSTARAPNGLAASEISLASVRVRAMPTVTGTPTRSKTRSRINTASSWNVCPRAGIAAKKNSSIE